MVKVKLKGGVWKNSEDEIQKAGIMKYGFHCWGAIASLLHKKTPKQCKARWSEWLDPSIRKTEWTREEEEKLLHLSKIFPNQWRTIASMMSRTAHQCLEHFTQLSDIALGYESASVDGASSFANDIEANAETKPARPDAIDMDEDEREMLHEARARLANTQGKKSKRKARERILDDARQLAQLQKARELRAAGIMVKEFKTKKGEMNHTVDIFNHHKTDKMGSFDVSSDKVLETQLRSKNSLIGKSVKQQEGLTKEEKEEKDRQKDIKKMALRKQMDLPGVISQIQKRNTSVYTSTVRPEQIQPKPSLSEGDLENIQKHGKQSELQTQVQNKQKERLTGASRTEQLLDQVRDVNRKMQQGSVVDIESYGQNLDSNHKNHKDGIKQEDSKSKQLVTKKTSSNGLQWDKFVRQGASSYDLEIEDVVDANNNTQSLQAVFLGKSGQVHEQQDKEQQRNLLLKKQAHSRKLHYERESIVFKRKLPMQESTVCPALSMEMQQVYKDSVAWMNSDVKRLQSAGPQENPFEDVQDAYWYSAQELMKEEQKSNNTEDLHTLQTLISKNSNTGDNHTDALYTIYLKEKEKVGKVYTTVSQLHGGYLKRSDKLQKDAVSKYQDLVTNIVKQNAMQELAQHEAQVLPQRLQASQALLKVAQNIQATQQQAYLSQFRQLQE